MAASKEVVATHTPVYDPNRLYERLSPARSYVLGLYAKGIFPDGMFIDYDPVHTYRTTPTDKGIMIIVAGDHGPVEVPDTGVFYWRLENYTHQHLDVESIEHRWSSTDVTTDDGLPIIGATSQKGIYVARDSDSGV
jgi:glycine/D-amino acid oxidase-like deaminating enzyme